MRRISEQTWRARICALSLVWMMAIAVTTSCSDKPHKEREQKPALSTKTEVTPEEEKGSEKLSAKYLKQRVENIYKYVCRAYNQCNINSNTVDYSPIMDADFEGKYCSSDWNSKMEEVIEINSKNEDEYSYPDADYWIMGQEWDNVSVSNVTVEKIDGHDAVVSFKFHNYGSTITVKLDMVFERDDWFIDNFHNEDYQSTGEFFDWKKDMVEYISENKNLKNKNTNKGSQNTTSTVDYPVNYYDPYSPSVDIYQEDNTPRQPIRKRCWACSRNPGQCGGCDGTGKVRFSYINSTGEWIMRDCTACGGIGRCHACGGDGWVD